jgi:hypothetical protein
VNHLRNGSQMSCQFATQLQRCAWRIGRADTGADQVLLVCPKLRWWWTSSAMPTAHPSLRGGTATATHP